MLCFCLPWRCQASVAFAAQHTVMTRVPDVLWPEPSSHGSGSVQLAWQHWAAAELHACRTWCSYALPQGHGQAEETITSDREWPRWRCLCVRESRGPMRSQRTLFRSHSEYTQDALPPARVGQSTPANYTSDAKRADGACGPTRVPATEAAVHLLHACYVRERVP